MRISKKMLVKIIFMLVIVSFILLNSNEVLADGMSLSEMESQASTFIETGKTQSASIDTAEIANNFVSLGQILTFVGAGVLVAVTTYMGIKYLTAGPEAQAKLKVQLIGIVVSGVVIFGAWGIWKTVINIASNFD